jgi:hypothetical protein
MTVFLGFGNGPLGNGPLGFGSIGFGSIGFRIESEIMRQSAGQPIRSVMVLKISSCRASFCMKYWGPFAPKIDE